MKNCAFTIVAKNYIGLAQILEKSIRQYYNELDFYIVVADEMDDELRNKVGDNILVAKEILNIEESLWQDMSFKYNLTEFCTSIKPASFKYFFQNYTYENCIYLDPDIYFFDSIGKVYTMLEQCDILLTPHITRIEQQFTGDYSEKGIMQTGIFNLGFCGLKRSDASIKIINWWHNRLQTFCFNDTTQGLFTDQKWMDMMPCYFENELNATKHLGMNLAPWNFHEREIIANDNIFKVKYRGDQNSKLYDLIFVHYSGFDYRKLKDGSIEQRNIDSTTHYSDIDIIMDHYAKNIRDNADTFDKFIAQRYTYNFYENGDDLTSFHRKLYKGLVEHNNIYLTPFSCGKGTLHELFLANKMINIGGYQGDKITKNNIKGVETKLKIFNKLTRVAYRIIGINKYLLLIRLTAVFSRYESNIHLLDKKFDTTNINR